MKLKFCGYSRAGWPVHPKSVVAARWPVHPK
ncbi:hypothetical protein AMST5_02789 [freshwater sediment metagenome]|uniref:Uncharacterized protein n=1 Tax=freshwater sediment metagenome TaxID=556182 RepID=A0AA48M0P8_9ZZZZ